MKKDCWQKTKNKLLRQLKLNQRPPRCFTLEAVEFLATRDHCLNKNFLLPLGGVRGGLVGLFKLLIVRAASTFESTHSRDMTLTIQR